MADDLLSTLFIWSGDESDFVDLTVLKKAFSL